MVAAVMASADEVVEAEERPVHQGCMAGFLHLFDRPQILSGRRLHHAPRRLMSSSSGSATPSERSMQLDRVASSPDMTPPAAPRPSLQLPPLDLMNGCGGASSGVGAAPSWRLPRLSLDSRAVVDGRGKYRPREIRAPSLAAAPPSPSSSGGDERRSPSVVARLMGLDALPHGQGTDGIDGGAAAAGALRRSASERVPRGDPSRFRFVDPSSFERPSSPLPQQQQRPSLPVSSPAPAETAMRRAPETAGARGIQRRSRFDAREVFPEPARRADPATAHGGEIALYGEIERRLRKRGIAEPARDLETLKQILEALQLKGLLHHNHAPSAAAVRTSPPPIVLMRPSYRAPPQQLPPAPPRLTPMRRLRVDVDRARRSRSPDASASPARSPASPARRGPQSPQRRVSPAQSPKQQPFRKSSSFDAAGARSRIARRAAQNFALLSPDEEASTTFSDGGSSSSFSASSRWDFEPQPVVLGDETSRKLERCGKLLSSIQAFTGGEAAAADQQPSPVSVLDAASFLADEDSPSSSSGSKRGIDFNVVRSPKAATTTLSDPEDDEWAQGAWPVVVGSSEACDPDYAYVAELVRLLHRKQRDPAVVYQIAEQRRRLLLPGSVGDGDDACQHRRLLCGAVAEALDQQRCLCPWDPASWLRGAELVDHVWAEVRRVREPVATDEDLNDVTRNAIGRDLAADYGPWASPSTVQPRRQAGPEVADAVLQIERLVFKDLVADTIRELADADRLLPRRKLVF